MSPSVKLVLLAYCLHASDQGLCWPSLARIATFTGLNQRTVQRHVRELEAAGALVCILHAKTSSKTYRINLDALEQSQRLTSQLQPDPPNMEEPNAPELEGWPVLDFAAHHDLASHVLPAITTRSDPAPQPQATPLVATGAPVGAGQDQQPDPDTLRRFAKLSERKGHGLVTADKLASLRAEGARVGLSLPEVLALCLERRWGTFRAEWLRTKPPAQGELTPPPVGWSLSAETSTPGQDLDGLTADGRAAARFLAQLKTASQQPPACPATIAHHRANLAKLRADFVANTHQVSHFKPQFIQERHE